MIWEYRDFWESGQEVCILAHDSDLGELVWFIVCGNLLMGVFCLRL